MKNILFVCTGNSARSIMAEAYMNKAGASRWRAFSAGSHPRAALHPLALDTLSAHGIDASGARPKSWDEFVEPSAPAMDVVVTVCDNAAGEVCPLWPSRGDGGPKKLHWSFSDPTETAGGDDEKRAAFESVFAAIRAKIETFLDKDA